ncbi:RhuM family protein [Eubacterium xylanophilum]|uniref:RhuM family protein n=1 Tax=Eubacterium xylanophilum TaxID=39497 RepID=UPI0004B76700|nr:RhuM family protein [Eubacterium xylanophilum]
MSNENNKSEIIIYNTEDGKCKVDVRLEEDTVWLTQEQMSELFQKAKSTINEHIQNIYADGELMRENTLRKFGNSEFSTKPTNYYNLDMIISVGYRVKSQRGVQFRIWASSILKEYLKKGFVMDDERLKNLGGGGYFKELLERIRDIRASEKVFYRQVLEIYATSIDYDPKVEESIIFFKKVQNKIHYAVSGETAAEVIYSRADAEKELRAMGQLVSGYLDFAERQAEREIPMTMSDWSKHLDGILTSTGEQLLVGNGTISHAQAMQKAENEYKKYKQKTLSDVEKDYLNSIEEISAKCFKK